MLSVFSPLVLSQVLPNCEAGPSYYFGQVFQDSYEASAPKVKFQVQHAIDNLFVQPEEAAASSGAKRKASEASKTKAPSEHPPLTEYQIWFEGAIQVFKASTARVKPRKGPTKDRIVMNPHQLMDEFLAKPPDVQRYVPGSYQDHTGTSESWDQEVKRGGVFSTRGDGRRLQLILTEESEKCPWKLHKDFLNELSTMMTKPLLHASKQSASAIYSRNGASDQDWHQDISDAPLSRLKSKPGKNIAPKWQDGRNVPGLMPLGSSDQHIRIIMGSHDLTEVCSPGHQTCD
jgi:hypothetical protein